jgi:hypothetical protein
VVTIHHCHCCLCIHLALVVSISFGLELQYHPPSVRPFLPPSHTSLPPSTTPHPRAHPLNLSGILANTQRPLAGTRNASDPDALLRTLTSPAAAARASMTAAASVAGSIVAPAAVTADASPSAAAAAVLAMGDGGSGSGSENRMVAPGALLPVEAHTYPSLGAALISLGGDGGGSDGDGGSATLARSLAAQPHTATAATTTSATRAHAALLGSAGGERLLAKVYGCLRQLGFSAVAATPGLSHADTATLATVELCVRREGKLCPPKSAHDCVV